MENQIRKKIHEIEDRENVRVLLAVESGSRAWGFASPDSDYDVRFIYVRRAEDYLRLEKCRDVIELPINDVLDINGWDLQKALRLMARSNPTLFEWLSSPIVYMEDALARELRAIRQQYFFAKKSMYHYVFMAERNAQKYLSDELVIAKKYFYILRPILACKWIFDKNTPPPVLFSELAAAELPESLRGDVKFLLDTKKNSNEVKTIQHLPAIDTYLTSSIVEIKGFIDSMDDAGKVEWDDLNKLFLDAVQSYTTGGICK